MSLTIQYTLVCDEVRVESNGKLMVIGLYTPNILIPQLPFLFPSLTFLQAFEADQPGRFQMRARLQHVETGKELGQAIGLLNIAQPVKLTVTFHQFRNLQIERVGLYSFIVNIEGQKDPILAEFEMLLRPMQPTRQ